MGKVLVTAQVENVGDLIDADLDRLAPSEVRAVEAADALVDTGARVCRCRGPYWGLLA